MTHGDFDWDYLRDLALDEKGRPRFARLSFAAHFDSLMRGRRGVPRPRDEAELNPYRARFVEMFRRLRQEHGIRSYLAHNMTVTPANLPEGSEIVSDVSAMGFSMLSFQPAAHVGDERRWKGGRCGNPGRRRNPSRRARKCPPGDTVCPCQWVVVLY